MIFSGYVFPNPAAIAPHLEFPQTGPTSLFCAKLAKRLICYVAAGFPERLHPNEHDRTLIGANSAVLYDPTGTCIGHYRKTNLYETDQSWAIPGTGFASFSLPPPLGTVSLAICMDLNPAPPTVWTYPTGPYELADFCRNNKSNLLILLNAWLDSGRDTDSNQDSHTLNYWAARLLPLWSSHERAINNSGYQHHHHHHQNTIHLSTNGDPHHTLVVISNRAGKENGITFAGSSAAFSLKPGSNSPNLLHVMDRNTEGVGVWNLPDSCSH